MPKPLIYAHRGSSFDHPENSRVAFMAAIQDGAHGFETDLRLTKDGQIVLWHDSNMQKLANDKAVIAHSNYSEIKSKYREVMLLEELLEIATTYKISLALETKHPVPSGNEVEHKVVEMVKPFLNSIKISLLSFSWLAIEKSARDADHLETVALMNPINQTIMKRFSSANSVAPALELIKADPSQVARYQRDGKRVFVWTVNEITDLELCAELGVDVVITDMPARAVSVLGYP
jgi:glycerophosphoryl diester phosphodiesterase